MRLSTCIQREIKVEVTAMRILLIVGLTAVFALAAFAAEGTPVKYQSGDETVSGVLYLPQGKGPFPALVVIHEWWGLVPWVKDQASKLADQGYASLAIDLYRGQVATTPEEAHELMRGVPEDRAARDLQAAAPAAPSGLAVAVQPAPGGASLALSLAF